MPKQLVVESTLINFQDDRGGVHHEAGDIVDVPKATAIQLARLGRTLFITKSDDPDKAGRNTATPELIKAAKEAAKAKEAAAAPAAKTGDQG